MIEVVQQVTLTDDNVRGIELLAASLGWPCYAVNLQGCRDKTTLLERCAEALAFPSWFGHNWDALFDCLIDLPSARRARGCVLVLRHAAEMQAAAPEVMDTALSIVADATQVWSGRGVTLRTFIS